MESKCPISGILCEECGYSNAVGSCFLIELMDKIDLILNKD